MAKSKFETRMILTVPERGIVTLEGSNAFVREFFNQIKYTFVEQMAQALATGETAGKDPEIVHKETAKGATLEIVEKAS